MKIIYCILAIQAVLNLVLIFRLTKIKRLLRKYDGRFVIDTRAEADDIMRLEIDTPMAIITETKSQLIFKVERIK